MELNSEIEVRNTGLSRADDISQALDEVPPQCADLLLLKSKWDDLLTHLELIKSNGEKKAKEVELSRKELECSKIALEKKDNEIKLKGNKLCLLERSIEECESQLRLKEEELEESKRRVADSSSELQSKTEEIEKRNKELQKVTAIYDSIVGSIAQCSLELESKKTKLKILEARIQDCSTKVMSGRFDVSYQVKTELQDDVSSASSSQNIQPCNITAFACSTLLKDKHEARRKEILDGFRCSQDPAEVVLKVMQQDIEHKRVNGILLTKKFLKDLIFLLEELINQDSLQIKDEVRDGAMELAHEWKREMSQNPLEISVFLLILAVYRLLDRFNRDELLQMVRSIAQYKHASKIVLRFVDEVPDIIEDLIKKEHYIGAVRFISSFGLTDKFPVASLIKKAIENLKRSVCNSNKENNSLETSILTESQEKCRKNSLRDIVGCIEEFNLGNRIPEELIQLKELIATISHVPLSCSPMDHSEMQLQQRGGKRSRLDGSVVRI